MRIPEAIIPRALGKTGQLNAAEAATATAGHGITKDKASLAAGSERAAAGASSPTALGTAGSFDGIASARLAEKPKIPGADSGLNLNNPSVVNHHNSLSLMSVCKDAYGIEKDATLSKGNHTEYQRSIGHSQFMIREYSDHSIITYGGSKEMKDWGHDANIRKEPYKDMGWVHKGFSSAYDEMLPEQNKILNKNKPVVVTGHSLGGATATVAALDLKTRGYDVHSLTTFGCPRVGGDSFGAAFGKANIPAFRYVNAWDVVPRIPKIDFQHVGQPFYLSTKGEMLPQQQSGWELAWKPWELASQRVDSHHMPNYMANLQKYLS